MIRFQVALVVYTASFFVSGLCIANPTIPAHERFKDDPSYQIHAGQLLTEELNCSACHASSETTSSKQAPILTEVMSRAKAEHLRKFISNPHATKPGTSMPALLTNVDNAEDKVNSILHYLGSLGKSQPEQSYATFGGKRRGEKLYHSVGCVACHNPADQKWSNSVPHGDLPSKYTLPSLAEFIRNPLHARPSGRMPSLNLSGREAADIASYLLPHIPEKAGIEWAYYELENLDRLPIFEGLAPTATGTTAELDINKIKKRDSHFAIRFEGAMLVAEPGEYQFFLGSDDGSKLWVDGGVVIDNDGVHGMQRKKGNIKLEAGSHSIAIAYFERDGGEEFEVAFKPPGGKRGPLGAELVSAAPQEPLEDLAFQVDTAKAKEGKLLFASLGCAACHEVGAPTKSGLTAPELAKLDPTKGCLATSNAPADYQLDDSQRTAIQDHLRTGKTTWDDEQQIQHTTLKFNCLACHQRGDLGGVEEQRVPHFQTTQMEMGVEGSIPPHLNDVGAKITLAWLEQILAEGAKDRPYMLTKMPKFGTNNVGSLAKLFASTDAMTPLAKVTVDEKAKKVGHRLVGDKGFSCIKCHTFGRHKATGVQSIDMTIMTKRLREDWFRSYIRDPQAYRKGTRMPSAWPVEGKSYLPDLLDGDSDKQIMAVWNYLKAGTSAITPSGLATGAKELIPIDEAIIYRNFIQGAGSRAIAVGSPEGLHFAFDANELHIAILWKGAYMNAARHWSGRGQGFEPPAGESVQQLVEGLPIATLASPHATWPESKATELDNYRFKGYQLTGEERYPTFMYQAAECLVRDLTTPKQTATNTTLLRKISISGQPKAQTYFRVAAGKVVADDSANGRRFDVGEGLKIEIHPSANQPLLRKSGDNDELLIPLAPHQSQDIELEYIW